MFPHRGDRSGVNYERAAAEQLRLPGSGLQLVGDRWRPPQGVAERGTVLLLHGGGQTRHSWRSTGVDLAAIGWTAIAIDARGHGDSEWDRAGDYSLSALVDDLLSVVDALGIRPVIVGASMGGMTALLAEGEHPGTARALVLVDITPQIEPEGSEEITTFMRSGIEGFDSLEDAAAAIVAYNPLRTQEPRLEGLRKNLRERQGRWFWHWDPRVLDAGDEPTRGEPRSAEFYERSLRAASAIRVPTLLVRGKHSKVVSEAGAAELLTLITDSELITVSGAGHMIAGDNNSVFTVGVEDFLDRRVGANASGTVEGPSRG